MRFVPLLLLGGFTTIGALTVWYTERKKRPLSVDDLLELQGTYLKRAAEADEFGTPLEAAGWRRAADSVADEIRDR